MIGVSIRADNLRKKLDGYAKRARASEFKAAAPSVFKAMREGERGISQMFRRGFTYWPNGTESKWKPTEPFGSLPPPRSRTLIRTGYYRDAWMGRHAGSIQSYVNGRFVLGVDEVMFPRAKVFQTTGITKIRITEKMRRFVAWAFDVHFKRSKKNVEIKGRPISVSPEMVGRAARVLKRFILNQREDAAETVSGGRARKSA